MATMNRMNREQFHVAIAGLDPDQLRKVLWTVYWRGTATVRERIETEIAPPEALSRVRKPAPAVDPDEVLDDVREFAALARSGAYFAGSRKVSPKARSQWRVTFRAMVTAARAALSADDTDGFDGTDAGAEALIEMIDLACETADHEYFRSDDPMEAAGVVVSDEVALLWSRMLERRGFEGFAAAAAEQFVRWEAPHGWTRRGYGRTAEKEKPLTDVLAGMLTVPDTWVTFTESFPTVLDGLAPLPSPGRRAGSGRSGASLAAGGEGDWRRRRRTEELSAWQLLLVDRFTGSEEEHLLDRLAGHPALGGPDATFVQARLAHARGNVQAACTLIEEALTELPGHTGYLAFAQQIGATLPPRARAVVERLPRR